MTVVQKLLASEPISTWRSIAQLPNGPIELWIVVFSDDGHIMGAAQTTHQPAWLWRNGRLSINYGPVHIMIHRRGLFKTGLICAVSPPTGTFQPIWPVDLGPSQQLRCGDDITITDGIIAITPDLPGPHG